MPTKATLRKLTAAARQICEDYGLDHVYFAQVLGRRRHFLAGFGKNAFARPERMTLGENTAMYWHGRLSDEDRDRVGASLQPLIGLLEEELTDE